MQNPFADRDHFVSPSTNQVRIVDLPGVSLPADVKGKLAFDLLSADALRARIRRRAADLDLVPDSPALLHDFNRCFTAVYARQRALAEAIAAEYGRCLGYVLLTLKRGDAVNRAARPDWGPAHWAFWHTIDTVYLGGGLVAGELGPHTARQAQAVMQEAGYPDYAVYLSPRAGDLTILGTASYALPNAGRVLLFDFGHSHVKRALAENGGGTAVNIRCLPSLEAPCHEFLAGNTTAVSPEQQAAWMLEVLAGTWAEVAQQGPAPEPTLFVSVACYLRDGHPLPGQMGCYGRLQTLTDNLQAYLTICLCERLEQPVQVRLFHDASAAAAVYAGTAKSAVLMLGTAVGTGFPPA